MDRFPVEINKLLNEFMTKKMQWQKRNIRRLKEKSEKDKYSIFGNPTVCVCVCKHHPSGTEEVRQRISSPNLNADPTICAFHRLQRL
jgi:hypothetical protein